MEPILQIDNLSKEYENFKLQDISLTLERGYIMGFIGPNGAGKSTTIKLILNLINRDSGDIKVLGKDNIRHEIDIKNKIGFVLDESHFYDEVTVTEMKSIIAPFYSKWDDSMFNKYIKEFELPKKKKIKELSKGMKMKFSLAVALSHNAEFLVMDEPTSGLDPVIRSEFLDILSELMQDENKGVFFSTHITSDLDKIADYVAFINKGRLVLNTTKDDILENYGVVKAPKKIAKNSSKDMFIGARENKYGFEGLVSSKHKAMKEFGEKVVVEKPTLEDIMVFYTRGNKDA